VSEPGAREGERRRRRRGVRRRQRGAEGRRDQGGSGDADGEIIDTRAVPPLTEALLDEALKAFRGDILQVPSMYSALKHQGQPLYKLARQGITVEREARPVTIIENRLLGFEGDRITLDIACSKGTYVRSIAEDLVRPLAAVPT